MAERAQQIRRPEDGVVTVAQRVKDANGVVLPIFVSVKRFAAEKFDLTTEWFMSLRAPTEYEMEAFPSTGVVRPVFSKEMKVS